MLHPAASISSYGTIAKLCALSLLAAGCVGRQAAQDLASELKGSAPSVRGEVEKFALRDEALVQYANGVTDASNEFIKELYEIRRAKNCEAIYTDRIADMQAQRSELIADILSETNRVVRNLESVADVQTEELKERAESIRDEILRLQMATGAEDVQRRRALELNYSQIAFAVKSASLRIYRKGVAGATGESQAGLNRVNTLFNTNKTILETRRDDCIKAIQTPDAELGKIFETKIDSNVESFNKLTAYLVSVEKSGENLEKYFQLNSLGPGGLSQQAANSVFGGVRAGLFSIFDPTKAVKAPTKNEIKADLLSLESIFASAISSFFGPEADLEGQLDSKRILGAIGAVGRQRIIDAAKEELAKFDEADKATDND